MKMRKQSAAPDVLAANEGTVFLFNPLTARAKEWIDDNVQPDALWFGTTLVCEHRYAWALAQGMLDEGLVPPVRRLGSGIGGEVFTETAQRLIRYGCTEPQVYALARVITIEPEATDAVIEQALIEVLVSLKEAVDGIADIEYLGGRRCDVQRRLEGRE